MLESNVRTVGLIQAYFTTRNSSLGKRIYSQGSYACMKHIVFSVYIFQKIVEGFSCF